MKPQFDCLENRHLQSFVGPVFDTGYIEGQMGSLVPQDVWRGQATPSRTPFILQPPPIPLIDPMDPVTPPLTPNDYVPPDNPLLDS